MNGEPWWERHERLKAVAGPKAKEDYKRKTRQITTACMNLKGELKLCPHLPWEHRGTHIAIERKTCRIVRCPRDEIEKGEK